jgi:phosphoglucomutase
MSDSEIIAAANGWLELDYHEPTKSAVKELLDAGNVAELRKLLGERLAFGTAGLRGPMGAGYNRMNHITVLQVCIGVIFLFLLTNRHLSRWFVVSAPKG